jgi:uncharacterized protein
VSEHARQVTTLASYQSPKTAVRTSRIGGRGLFAHVPIAEGEIVCVKGGHLLTKAEFANVKGLAKEAELQIADDLFLSPVAEAEFEGLMMFLNHSCEPNVGIQGQIVFVAIRAIAAGEELTLDYATIERPAEPMACRCGAERCRGTITGQDWQKKARVTAKVRPLLRLVSAGESASRASPGSLNVGRVPGDGSHTDRVLAVAKANLEARPPSLGYRVVRSALGPPVVEWTGPVEVTADELGTSRPADAGLPARERAVAWLRRELAGGPRRAADVYAAAAAARIPDRTLNRAKGDLRAESHREYDRKSKRGEWWWYDPAAPWPKDAPFKKPVPELPDFPPLPRW